MIPVENIVDPTEDSSNISQEKVEEKAIEKVEPFPSGEDDGQQKANSSAEETVAPAKVLLPKTPQILALMKEATPAPVQMATTTAANGTLSGGKGGTAAGGGLMWRRIGSGAKLGASTMEETSTSVGSPGEARRKFRTIAKGLGMISRTRALTNSNVNREQQAFFVKYGISMDAAASNDPAATSGAARLFGNCPQGMSKWEFIRKRLVVDPSQDYYYRWMGIVTGAYAYNLFFVVFRSVFLDPGTPLVWLCFLGALDVVADLVYGLDCFVRSRIGYLEQGLVVRDVRKVTKAYWRRRRKYVDFASVLPVELVYMVAFRSPNPFLRLNRLICVDRPITFINNTEMRVSRPNIFRVCCVVCYIITLIHWNACLYYIISYWVGFGADSWAYGKANKQSLPDGVEDTLARRYIYSIYWSTLILTTLGEVPWPVLSVEMIFVALDCMCGVLIFATIVGNVGSMIGAMGEARTLFQGTVDATRTFLKASHVDRSLVHSILKWFDYQWEHDRQSVASHDQVLAVLPTKLQAEIAMHVHFETLRKVRIFQDCEAGLLAELVLKLELQVFAPGEYVCRKGDIGREMYIVKRGRLQVIAEDANGKSRVVHTLHESAVFGELSILNIPGNKQGNRRSASIRSVGYSDLFSLNKDDLWEALREYPDAKKMLIQKGRQILDKDGLLDETAPVDTKSPEETIAELREAVVLLETRLARLYAEHLSSETKLQARVDALCRELAEFEGEEVVEDEKLEDNQNPIEE